MAQLNIFTYLHQFSRTTYKLKISTHNIVSAHEKQISTFYILFNLQNLEITGIKVVFLMLIRLNQF